MISRVEIGGVEYKVMGDKCLIDQDGSNLNGFINFDACIIGIDTSISAQKKLIAFMHEVIHGALVQSGIPKADVDERIPVSLSHSLISVFRSMEVLEVMLEAMEVMATNDKLQDGPSVHTADPE